MDVSRATEAGQAPAERVAGAAGMVLLTLASAQFLMTLDSSVMNVSIATVAKDVGTTVTGIQAAILSVRRRNGLPSRPSWCPSHFTVMPTTVTAWC